MQVGWDMARRSALDLEYGDDIRAKVLVPCPQCLVATTWRGVDELETHVRACRIIELGQAVGSLEVPPLDDLLPEVPRKPRGFTWSPK